MTIRELLRPLPGMRQIPLLRQRMADGDFAHFWEGNYAQGRTGGNGSFGALAEGKSRFLNELVRERAVRSVIEFGLDVSRITYRDRTVPAVTAPHVLHRHCTPWVEASCPGCNLTGVTAGPNTERARADFFVYERL